VLIWHLHLHPSFSKRLRDSRQIQLPKKFSKLIADLRERAGLTQKEAAELAGLASYRLSRIEGQARVELARGDAQALLKAFGSAEQLDDYDWDEGLIYRELRERGRAVSSELRSPVRADVICPSLFPHKLHTARRHYYNVVRGFERQIQQRQDVREIYLGLRDTWCDSGLETLLWLQVAARVGKPVVTSTLAMGFRCHDVTCWEGKLSLPDRERLAWHLPCQGLLFPQVTFRIEGRPLRVDALACLRDGQFRAIEVDGEAHRDRWDGMRDKSLMIPVIRLRERDLHQADLLERIFRV
jgi:transcriptional regulator with XRE-family HTH domain